MKRYIKEIVTKGDRNGNGMVVRFQLPSGLEIFGLPTENFYGGHWDLGPTWNFVVMADAPFLVDSGRFGQGGNLIDMMRSAHIRTGDLEFVLISHGHEDHDGGLAELVRSTDLKVKAHTIYDLLIRTYADQAPPGDKREFPAKCWHCPMPESFYAKNCLGYHQVLQKLEIERIADDKSELGPDIRTYHLPGHSPDCLAVLLGTEAVIVGDIVLPEITPWPTREALYDDVAGIVKHHYKEPGTIFGLGRYIKSLKKLYKIAGRYPGILVFPAHRMFYGGRWNDIFLADRINEIIGHHIQRCSAILEILRNGPLTAEEIAQEHFDEDLLAGFGGLMAANEIISHCEVLIKNGDLIAGKDKRYAATGKSNFEKDIGLNSGS
jgi:glyoxylase-like metal-dependent hydrolase (beta-lactamase superfamily II)